jgi:rod shape determining protein RodA
MTSAPPLTSSASVSSWRGFDWPLFVLVLLISIWGCFTIISATVAKDEVLSARPPVAALSGSAPLTSDSAVPTSETGLAGFLRGDGGKQLVWVALGVLLLLALAATDFQWLMYLQGWLYTFNCGLLILVLLIGREINGAKSWIRLGPLALQPAEISKFLVLVTLAAWLCRRQERIRELGTVVLSLVYLAPVLLLIMKQPDFGTMLATLAIWFGMLFFSGARLRHLALVVGCGLALFTVAWKAGEWKWFPEKAKVIALKQHQKDRLAVFLNPNPTGREAREAAYQVTQSQIAIGAGQITGQGFGQGMQKRGGWVPENDTDFVFTVVAEELGFAGAALLLLLYLALLLRTAWIATSTDNYFGALIAGGFTMLIAFHAIINLGMTMRVMPITGVPLPFFSYGGSSYLAFAAGVGLLQSVIMRQRKSRAW